MKNPYDVTIEFEKKLCEYTGAKYAVVLDNASNALFLSLYYEKNISKTLKTNTITIPERTYMSVPCEIINAGLKVKFKPVEGKTIKGVYQLEGSNVWDSALRFTSQMYIPGSFMCISFTGALKTFKLGSKGGAILCDSKEAYEWFKKARFSGRNEISYHEDNFTQTGWNFYINPELSLRGLIMMTQFYDNNEPKHNPDVELPYPKLSDFDCYKVPQQNFTREEIENKLMEFNKWRKEQGDLGMDEPAILIKWMEDNL